MLITEQKTQLSLEKADRTPMFENQQNENEGSV